MNHYFSYFKKAGLICLVLLLCFALGACGGSSQKEEAEDDVVQNSGDTLRIATKNTPEQNILAHLAQILIREKMGMEAEIVYFEDSTSTALLEKMNRGSIELFFDYSGSLAVNALKIDTEKVNIPTLILDVQNNIRKSYDITVSEEIGYNSSTAFYMMIERREELGSPATISQVAKMSSDLKIGMNEAFYNRIDCYAAFCELYETEFKKALVYNEDEDGFRALINGDIDVYVGPSVSPYRSLLNVKQLVDDKYFILPQNTCCLMSNKALKDYPELESTIEHLEGLISESRMSLMVKRIYWEGNPIDDYIHTYLRANNII